MVLVGGCLTHPSTGKEEGILCVVEGVCEEDAQLINHLKNL